MMWCNYPCERCGAFTTGIPRTPFGMPNGVYCAVCIARDDAVIKCDPWRHAPSLVRRLMLRRMEHDVQEVITLVS